MKIAIVTPHIPDTRHEFMKQRNKLMEQQTRQADIDVVIDYPYKAMDLPQRYRDGFERAFAQGADLAFAIEDDDYYAPDYIEQVVHEWEQQGKPDIFGINFTIYYHLKQRAYKFMKHPNRSSMFCTAVTRRVLDFNFGDTVWLDILLWQLPIKKGFAMSPPNTIGIKHGEGICGGSGHTMNYQFDTQDKDHKYLKQLTQDVFYTTY